MFVAIEITSNNRDVIGNSLALVKEATAKIDREITTLTIYYKDVNITLKVIPLRGILLGNILNSAISMKRTNLQDMNILTNHYTPNQL